METFFYHAFGLSFESAVALDLNTGRGPADVQFSLREERPSSFQLLDHPHSQHDGNSCYFHWPDEAIYHVQDGRRVDITPLGPIQRELFQLSLMGPVFCALSHQRRDYPLHGSSVLSPKGKAIAFLGDQGAGKSTTAAHFIAKGFSFLSDDIVILKNNKNSVNVMLGPPQQKLEEKWLKRYHWKGSELQQLHPSLRKWQVKHPQMSQPHQPLGAICVFSPSEHFSWQRLSGTQAYLKLLSATHTAHWLEQSPDAIAHLHWGQDLLQNVPLYNIHWPRSPEALDELEAFVEQLDLGT